MYCSVEDDTLLGMVYFFGPLVRWNIRYAGSMLNILCGEWVLFFVRLHYRTIHDISLSIKVVIKGKSVAKTSSTPTEIIQTAVFNKIQYSTAIWHCVIPKNLMPQFPLEKLDVSFSSYKTSHGRVL